MCVYSSVMRTFGEAILDLYHRLREIMPVVRMEDRIEEHFRSLKSAISHLSAEFKEEVENIKTNLKEVEKSLQSVWDSINDIEADAKTHSNFKKANQQTLDSHLQ